MQIYRPHFTNSHSELALCNGQLALHDFTIFMMNSSLSIPGFQALDYLDTIETPEHFQDHTYLR